MINRRHRTKTASPIDTTELLRFTGDYKELLATIMNYRKLPGFTGICPDSVPGSLRKYRSCHNGEYEQGEYGADGNGGGHVFLAALQL